MTVNIIFPFFLNLRVNHQVDGKIQSEKKCLIFDIVFNDINNVIVLHLNKLFCKDYIKVFYQFVCFFCFEICSHSRKLTF